MSGPPGPGAGTGLFQRSGYLGQVIVLEREIVSVSSPAIQSAGSKAAGTGCSQGQASGADAYTMRRDAR